MQALAVVGAQLAGIKAAGGRQRVALGNEADEGLGRIACAQAGQVDVLRGLDGMEGQGDFPGAVEAQALRLQRDHGVAARQGDHGIVGGEQAPVGAKAGREALRGIAGPDQQLAARGLQDVAALARPFGAHRAGAQHGVLLYGVEAAPARALGHVGVDGQGEDAHAPATGARAAGGQVIGRAFGVAGQFDGHAGAVAARQGQPLRLGRRHMGGLALHEVGALVQERDHGLAAPGAVRPGIAPARP